MLLNHPPTIFRSRAQAEHIAHANNQHAEPGEEYIVRPDVYGGWVVDLAVNGTVEFTL